MQPSIEDGRVQWQPTDINSADDSIIASVEKPFDSTGGINLLSGNLGRAVIKTSAVANAHRSIKAPAKVFESQAEFLKAFDNDELNQDFVAVLVNQGPRANGMPELHKLTPALGVLQDAGYKVALVTDGRMSGASGKVPAAIHVSPECVDGGPLAKVRDGDIIILDANSGTLNVANDSEDWQLRDSIPLSETDELDCGRNLFRNMRATVSTAETGALSLFNPEP